MSSVLVQHHVRKVNEANILTLIKPIQTSHTTLSLKDPNQRFKCRKDSYILAKIEKRPFVINKCSDRSIEA